MKKQKKVMGGFFLIMNGLIVTCCTEVKPLTDITIDKKPQRIYVAASEVNFGSDTNLEQNLKIEAEETNWSLTGLNPEWISASATSGKNTTDVVLKVTENMSMDEARIATLNVSSKEAGYPYSKDIAVRQNAKDVIIKPEKTSVSFKAVGGTQTIAVESNSEWKADCSETWLTASKEGNNVKITVAANNTYSRTATITLMRTTNSTVVSTITVSQEEVGITGSEEILYFNVEGGTKSITISATSEWTSYPSDASWISLSPTSGNDGVTSLSITIPENHSTKERDGFVYVKIGDNIKLSIPIHQEGVSLSVSESSLSFGAGVETKTFAILSNTDWTVISSPSWLTVSPSQGGKEQTTIAVESKDNPNTTERNGEIVIETVDGLAKSTISIIQTGKNFWDIDAELSFSCDGGNQTLNIQTDGIWVASTDATWIKVSPGTGSGTTPLVVTIDENSEEDKRTGIITVSVGDTSKKINISQEGRLFKLAYNDIVSNSNPSTIKVSITSNIEWTAASDASWLSVNPSNGSGNAEIVISVADNPSVNKRTGNVRIATKSKTTSIELTQPGRLLSLDFTKYIVYADGGTSPLITITSDGEYEISSSDNWITINKKSNNTFTISVEKLSSAGERAGTVTVSLTNLQNNENLSKTIDVVQTGNSLDIDIDDWGEIEDWD